MMIKEYIGRMKKFEYFECQRCSKNSTEKFKAVPTIPSLVDWKELYICKPCATKEAGTKNKKLISNLMNNKK